MIKAVEVARAGRLLFLVKGIASPHRRRPAPVEQRLERLERDLDAWQRRAGELEVLLEESEAARLGVKPAAPPPIPSPPWSSLEAYAEAFFLSHRPPDPDALEEEAAEQQRVEAAVARVLARPVEPRALEPWRDHFDTAGAALEVQSGPAPIWYIPPTPPASPPLPAPRQLELALPPPPPPAPFGRARPRKREAAAVFRAKAAAWLGRGSTGAFLIDGRTREQRRSRRKRVDGPRPCPFVSCHHHLYLEVNGDNGSIKLNFPDLEPDELAETCALDVADRGETTLEAVGAIMNITRERVRQIEVRAMCRIKETDTRARGPLASFAGEGERRMVRRLPILVEDEDDEGTGPEASEAA